MATEQSHPLSGNAGQRELGPSHLDGAQAEHPSEPARSPTDGPAAGEAEDVAGALARGRVRFFGLDLVAGPEVLVPRRETELLARTALQLLTQPGAPAAPRVVDVGCGTGNITCAIAAKVEQATVWACDLAAAAVTLTRRNAEALGLSDRVHVVEGDLFAPLAAEAGLAGTVDLVVCNPPYISSGRLTDGESRRLLEQEPRTAFDGGPFGITIHQRIVREAPAWLRAGGWLAVEVGAGQAQLVERLFLRARTYEDVATAADESGLARVVFGRASGARADR